MPQNKPREFKKPWTDYEGYISKYSGEFGIDPDLIKAIIATESSFNPNVVSSSGAKGLMQLKPIAAKDVGLEDANLFDPEQNIRVGSTYFSKLLERFGGDMDKALAAYRFGPTRVTKKGIPDTKYIDSVKKNLDSFKPKEDYSGWNKIDKVDITPKEEKGVLDKVIDVLSPATAGAAEIPQNQEIDYSKWNSISAGGGDIDYSKWKKTEYPKTFGELPEPEPESGIARSLLESPITGPIVGAAEALGSIGTGFAAFPASGISSLVNLATGGTLEEAAKVGEETAGMITYEPKSPYGRTYTEAAGKIIGFPAEVVRNFGEKMVEWGASPLLATVVTTPAEFALYAYLFRKAHKTTSKIAERAFEGKYPSGAKLRKTIKEAFEKGELDLPKAERILEQTSFEAGERAPIVKGEPSPLLKPEGPERTNIESREHLKRVQSLRDELNKLVPKEVQDARKAGERVETKGEQISERGEAKAPEGRVIGRGEEPVRLRDFEENWVDTEATKLTERAREEGWAKEKTKPEVVPEYKATETISAEESALLDYDLNKRKFKTYEQAEKFADRKSKDPGLVEEGLVPEVLRVGDDYRVGVSLALTPEMEKAFIKRSQEARSSYVNLINKGELDLKAVESTLRSYGDLVKEWHQGDKNIELGQTLLEEISKTTSVLDPRNSSHDMLINAADRMAELVRTEIGRELGDPSIRIFDHPIRDRADKGSRIIMDPNGSPFNNPMNASRWMEEKGIKGRVEDNPLGEGFVIETGKIVEREKAKFKQRLEEARKERERTKEQISEPFQRSVPKEVAPDQGEIIATDLYKEALTLEERIRSSETAPEELATIRDRLQEIAPILKEFREKRGISDLKEFFSRKLSEERGSIEVDLDVVREGLRKRIEPFKNWLTMKTWPDPHSKIYENVGAVVEKHRMQTNRGMLEATMARDLITDRVKDVSARERITTSIEDPSVVLENPLEIAMAERAKAFFDLYRDKLNEAGLLDQFLEDYAPHVIRKSPEGNFITNVDIAKFKRRSRHDGEWRTIRELEEAGYTMEKDIANLLPMYIYTAEKAIANKNFARQLLFAEDLKGEYILMPGSEVPLGAKNETYFRLQKDSKLRSWMWLGRKSEKNKMIKPDTPTREKKLLGGKDPVYVHKNAYNTLENILASDPSEIYTKVSQLRSGVKRLVMYNPLIHGFNFESNVLSALGRDYIKHRYFHGMDQKAWNNLAMELVDSGGELMGLYNIGKRIGGDIYEMRPLERIKFEDLIDDPSLIVKRPLKTIIDVGDNLLWDKWIKTGQLIIYKTAKERFKEKFGLSDVEAKEAAAMYANDLSGSPPRTWFTLRQRRSLTTLLFARSWNVGLLRTLTGAAPGKVATSKYTPKFLRFEGVSENQLKALKPEYRKLLVKGLIGFVATANMLQMGMLSLTGHKPYPTVMNEKDHKLDIATGLYDDEGNMIYVRNWLFRQMDDYFKIIKGELGRVAASKMEPVLKMLVELVLNVDSFRGKKIIERGMMPEDKAKALLKHIMKGLTPVDTFVPEADEVLRWYDVLVPLTGTFIRKGVSADPLFGTMIKEFYDWQSKDKYADMKLKNNIIKLLKDGREKDAVDAFLNAAREGKLSEKQFENIYNRLKNPLWYRIAGPNGLEPEFVRFLLELRDKDPKKYEMFYKRMKRLAVKPPKIK